MWSVNSVECGMWSVELFCTPLLFSAEGEHNSVECGA